MSVLGFARSDLETFWCDFAMAENQNYEEIMWKYFLYLYIPRCRKEDVKIIYVYLLLTNSSILLFS